MQTTVSLSEKAYINLSDIARLTERSIDEVIEETFEDRLAEQVEGLKKNLKFLVDAEVLALADLQMPEEENKRLSKLLEDNREGIITEHGKSELGDLMQVNRSYDLRKAIAIVEAMKRGIIDSASDLG
jgi:transcriptional regulator of NAD metabolism